MDKPDQDNGKDPQPSKLFCEVCSLDYPTEMQFFDHQWSALHHNQMEKKYPRFLHHCRLCNFESCNIGEYLKHLIGQQHKDVLERRKEKALAAKLEADKLAKQEAAAKKEAERRELRRTERMNRVSQGRHARNYFGRQHDQFRRNNWFNPHYKYNGPLFKSQMKHGDNFYSYQQWRNQKNMNYPRYNYQRNYDQNHFAQDIYTPESAYHFGKMSNVPPTKHVQRTKTTATEVSFSVSSTKYEKDAVTTKKSDKNPSKNSQPKLMDSNNRKEDTSKNTTKTLISKRSSSFANPDCSRIKHGQSDTSTSSAICSTIKNSKIIDTPNKQDVASRMLDTSSYQCRHADQPKPDQRTAVDQHKPGQRTAVDQLRPSQKTAVGQHKPGQRTAVDQHKPGQKTAVDEYKPGQRTAVGQHKPGQKADDWPEPSQSTDVEQHKQSPRTDGNQRIPDHSTNQHKEGQRNDVDKSDDLKEDEENKADKRSSSKPISKSLKPNVGASRSRLHVGIRNQIDNTENPLQQKLIQILSSSKSKHMQETEIAKLKISSGLQKRLRKRYELPLRSSDGQIDDDMQNILFNLRDCNMTDMAGDPELMAQLLAFGIKGQTTSLACSEDFSGSVQTTSSSCTNTVVKQEPVEDDRSKNAHMLTSVSRKSRRDDLSCVTSSSVTNADVIGQRTVKILNDKNRTQKSTSISKKDHRTDSSCPPAVTSLPRTNTDVVIKEEPVDIVDDDNLTAQKLKCVSRKGHRTEFSCPPHVSSSLMTEILNKNTNTQKLASVSRKDHRTDSSCPPAVTPLPKTSTDVFIKEKPVDIVDNNPTAQMVTGVSRKGNRTDSSCPPAVTSLPRTSTDIVIKEEPVDIVDDDNPTAQMLTCVSRKDHRTQFSGPPRGISSTVTNTNVERQRLIEILNKKRGQKSTSVSIKDHKIDSSCPPAVTSLTKTSNVIIKAEPVDIVDNNITSRVVTVFSRKNQRADSSCPLACTSLPKTSTDVVIKEEPVDIVDDNPTAQRVTSVSRKDQRADSLFPPAVTSSAKKSTDVIINEEPVDIVDDDNPTAQMLTCVSRKGQQADFSCPPLATSSTITSNNVDKNEKSVEILNDDNMNARMLTSVSKKDHRACPPPTTTSSTITSTDDDIIIEEEPVEILDDESAPVISVSGEVDMNDVSESSNSIKNSVNDGRIGICKKKSSLMKKNLETLLDISVREESLHQELKGVEESIQDMEDIIQSKMIVLNQFKTSKQKLEEDLKALRVQRMDILEGSRQGKEEPSNNRQKNKVVASPQQDQEVDTTCKDLPAQKVDNGQSSTDTTGSNPAYPPAIVLTTDAKNVDMQTVASLISNPNIFQAIQWQFNQLNKVPTNPDNEALIVTFPQKDILSEHEKEQNSVEGNVMDSTPVEENKTGIQKKRLKKKCTENIEDPSPQRDNLSEKEQNSVDENAMDSTPVEEDKTKTSIQKTKLKRKCTEDNEEPLVRRQSKRLRQQVVSKEGIEEALGDSSKDLSKKKNTDKVLFRGKKDQPKDSFILSSSESDKDPNELKKTPCKQQLNRKEETSSNSNTKSKEVLEDSKEKSHKKKNTDKISKRSRKRDKRKESRNLSQKVDDIHKEVELKRNSFKQTANSEPKKNGNNKSQNEPLEEMQLADSDVQTNSSENLCAEPEEVEAGCYDKETMRFIQCEEKLLSMKIANGVLYCTCKDNIIRAYNIQTGNLEARYVGSSEILCIEVFEEKLFVSYAELQLAEFNLKTHEREQDFYCSSDVLCMHYNGNALYIGMRSGIVAVVNSDKRNLNIKYEDPSSIKYITSAKRQNTNVLIIVSGTIFIIKETTGEVVVILKSDIKTKVIDINVLGAKLYTASKSGIIYVHSIDTGNRLQSICVDSYFSQVQIVGQSIISFNNLKSVIKVSSGRNLQIKKEFSIRGERLQTALVHNQTMILGGREGIMCFYEPVIHFIRGPDVKCRWRNCGMLMRPHRLFHHFENHCKDTTHDFKCNWNRCHLVLKTTKSLRKHIKMHLKGSKKVNVFYLNKL
ncbi:uncharacterized protein [Antedon mediterranea]|uniref:uncharacterized protein n=1 Tax=Antedon mediterranea TaxID=105859 RepID=UPI003AF92231